jgi:hypothetical protein
MANCLNGVYQNILNECGDQVSAGLEEVMYVINRQDIASTTTLSGNTYIVSDITLLSGKTAFKVKGVKSSNTASYAIALKEFSMNKYTHSVQIYVTKQDAATIKQLDAIDDVVFIVENRAKSTADGTFKIYGLEQGLWVSEATQSSADNDNLHILTLSSQEGKEESSRPKAYFDTDYATTKAALEAMLA